MRPAGATCSPPSLRMPELAICGSISADYIGYGPHLPRAGETVLGDRLLIAPGGKGANVAVAAARLGARVRFHGARGDDANGELIGRALAAEGIDVSALRVLPDVASGVALICVDERAENQILTLPGANGRVGPPTPCGARVWFCPGEIPRAAHVGTLAAARADRAIAIVNPSPANAFDPELLPLFDIAIVNEGELQAFAESLPERVIVTRGRSGAVVLPDGPEFAAHPAIAVDTTGAGDAFAGGICAGLTEGLTLDDAIRLALVTAALSVEREGCQPSYPTRAEVDRRNGLNDVSRS